jgi:hypothetical protein
MNPPDMYLVPLFLLSTIKDIKPKIQIIARVTHDTHIVIRLERKPSSLIVLKISMALPLNFSIMFIISENILGLTVTIE